MELSLDKPKLRGDPLPASATMPCFNTELSLMSVLAMVGPSTD